MINILRAGADLRSVLSGPDPGLLRNHPQEEAAPREWAVDTKGLRKEALWKNIGQTIGSGDAVAGGAAGMEAYLDAEAAGATEEEAFAAALGRAVERYLDSLDDGERIRVLVGLLRSGTTVPEENMLAGSEDEEGRKKSALAAAADLAEAGELRRVRSRKDGRVFWVRSLAMASSRRGFQPLSSITSATRYLHVRGTGGWPVRQREVFCR